MIVAVSPQLTFWSLLPGLVLFGIGIGFAGSQLTNVILSEIPNDRSGAASGANTTIRQLGAALGIATIGGLLTSRTIASAVGAVRDVAACRPRCSTTAESGLHTNGVNFRAPRRHGTGRRRGAPPRARDRGRVRDPQRACSSRPWSSHSARSSRS